MTKRVHAPGIVALGALTLLVGIAAAQPDPRVLELGNPGAEAAPNATAAKKKIRLEDSTVIVEVNDTEGDAGLQFFLDGEPWRSMKIFRPGGKKVLDLNATGRLRNFGLTESLLTRPTSPSSTSCRSASSSGASRRGPTSSPGGRSRGRSWSARGGCRTTSRTARRSSRPPPDSTVPDGNVTPRWAPVPEAGIEIEGCRVIVEREDPFRSTRSSSRPIRRASRSRPNFWSRARSTCSRSRRSRRAET